MIVVVGGSDLIAEEPDAMTLDRALLPGLLAGILALPAFAQDPQVAPDAPEIHVVRLKQARANELSEVLRQFIREGSQSAGVSAVTIASHEETNSLLVSSGVARWRELEQLIAQLDVPGDVPGDEPGSTGVQTSDDVVRLVSSADRPMSVADLAELAQQQTGAVYAYDARGVGARSIVLVGTIKVPREQFAPMFEVLLAVHGMGIELRGEGDSEVREIVPLRDDAGRGKRFVPIEHVDQAGRGDVLTLVHLHHLDARQAVNDLQRFLPADTIVGAIGAGRSVLIQGSPDGVAEVAQVLRTVDESARVRTATRVVILEHLDAATMVQTLNQLFGMPAGPAQMVYTSFRAVSVGEEVLVLAGPDDQVEASLDVLARLDVDRR